MMSCKECTSGPISSVAWPRVERPAWTPDVTSGPPGGPIASMWSSWGSVTEALWILPAPTVIFSVSALMLSAAVLCIVCSLFLRLISEPTPADAAPAVLHLLELVNKFFKSESFLTAGLWGVLLADIAAWIILFTLIALSSVDSFETTTTTVIFSWRPNTGHNVLVFVQHSFLAQESVLVGHPVPAHRLTVRRGKVYNWAHGSVIMSPIVRQSLIIRTLDTDKLKCQHVVYLCVIC